MKKNHHNIIAGISLLLLALGIKTQAADYSTDLVTKTAGEYTLDLSQDSNAAPFIKHHITNVTHSGLTLNQTSDGYYSSGKITSQAIDKKQFRYYESASITIDADIPDGTTIDLYLRTVDPDGSGGVHTRARKWTKVTPGEVILLGAFADIQPSYDVTNNLRWRAVLSTTDSTIAPVLHSVAIKYYNAAPSNQRITLLQNTFGVNNTANAAIKVTIFGEDFRPNQEQVYLKNLLPANSVTWKDSHTLIAEFPISTLSAGTYTIAVRNTNSGRIGVTDGAPLNDWEASVGTINVPAVRLVLKGAAPTISSLSPTIISYFNGGTLTIHGQNFAYGSRVKIGDTTLSDTTITVVNSSAITVALSSGTISNWPRNKALTVTVTSPDYQTVSYTGLTIN